MRKLLIIGYCLISFLAFSQKKKFSYTSNENIPEVMKTQIQQLNNRIFSFIRNKQIDSLQAYFSPEALKNLGNLEEQMPMLQKIVPPKEYKVIDEYWGRGLKPGASVPVISSSLTYFINYPSDYEESYVKILRFNQGNVTLQTICFYGRKDKNHPWKMSFFNTSSWGFNDQGALEYYQKSKKFQAQGYLLNAYLEAKIALDLARASQGIFQFQQEADMSKHLNALAKKMNEAFKLPILLDSIPDKPEIVTVIPQDTPQGFFPMIIYLTDTTFEPDFLKKECDLIHQQIEKVFPGITKFRAKIFYRAYNRKDKERKKHYGIIKKTPLPKD
ncbi:hypothetical protein BKI52_22670 [marine bacterium AO1-C]|nr:hypothetical protein BKI52_22670 [marine bacterium AO1-C]